MSSEDHHKFDADSVEKNQLDVGVHVVADGRHKFDVASIDLVQRQLKQRHVQMYV
jgi:amino acid transporter